MKKLFLVAVICTSLSAFGQTANNRVANYMNQENWFELQREFAVNKDSLNPFLYDFGQALLYNFFNHPEAACEAIGKLLAEQQENMGFENTASMIYLLTENLSKLGANDQAAETLKSFCDQLTGQVDSAFLTGYRRKEKEYRVLSGYALYQWEKPETDLVLPIRIDSIGKRGSGATTITLEGNVNGKEQNFTLDTGAGVNVVTPEVAKACGMKILDIEITANGVGTGSGQFAIAEEIKIGPLVMRNIPFYVLDMKTGDEKADRYMKHLEAIIGLPILNQLQEIKLDFRTNRLTIPKSLTPAPGFAPNICFTSKNILDLEVVYDHELLRMNLDSGSGLSQLNYDYFERHKDHIERIAERDSMGLGGFGGTARVCIYRLPSACFQIGEYLGCTDSLSIVATPEQNGVHFAGQGIMGMDIFRSFSTITINMRDMFVKTTPRTQGVNATIYDPKKLHLNIPEKDLKITDVLLGITGFYLDWWNSRR